MSESYLLSEKDVQRRVEHMLFKRWNKAFNMSFWFTSLLIKSTWMIAYRWTSYFRMWETSEKSWNQHKDIGIFRMFYICISPFLNTLCNERHFWGFSKGIKTGKLKKTQNGMSVYWCLLNQFLWKSISISWIMLKKL